MPGFQVEQLAERAALRGVQVPLHVPIRDPRPCSQALCQVKRLLLEPGVGNHPIYEAQPEGLMSVEQVSGVVQLASLGGPNQPGQEKAAAEVPRVTDAREGGAEPRAVPGNP